MELEALIEARPARRDHLVVWYGQLLEAADRARVSVADLAERLNCSRETIYAWRRRVGPAARAEPRPQTPGLVRVQVAERTQSVGLDHLEIRLRSGRSVLVPATFEPTALAAVLEVLERC